MIGRLEKKESSIPSGSKGVAEANQMGCAANNVVSIKWLEYAYRQCA